MALTVGATIAAALRPIIQSSSPSSAEYTDAMQVLNTMLMEWAMVPSLNKNAVRENFTLVDGTASYTIGPGATFSTVRPLKIVKAFTRSDSIDYNMIVLYGIEEYANREQKALEDRPSEVFLEQGVDTCTLLFYPTPDYAYDFHIWSYKGFAYSSSTTYAYNAFTSTTQSLNLGPQYEPAVIANLRLALYEEFGKQPNAVTVQKAQETLAALKRLQIQPPVPINTDPLGHTGGYDIDSDMFE